ncbi:HD domain-containing protein [Calothrix sp. PCC 6303]|uniref:HD domain-containing protein n=1 Tax=Calothrix sp. PCC 6303 TaxID=1170562 RepID=UPI0002A045D6|nr:HD domain-containing protein [Calothrix sp. PCC 6303]AFZ03256.1 hypothetical protein Cal6303_4349 [Calothrix sp. PCC 6303]
MKELQIIDRVRSEIVKMAQDPHFIHHKWYVKHHLKIVEQISLELCQIYQDADQDLVLLLVWMHDYGKITNQSATKSKVTGESFLIDEGVGIELAQQVMNNIEVIDRKDISELKSATDEIKIVSSADGASHMVGSFFSIYWWENSHLSIEELQARNLQKLQTDWEKKIVLPEVKQAFATHYQFLLSNFRLPTYPISTKILPH